MEINDSSHRIRLLHKLVKRSYNNDLVEKYVPKEPYTLFRYDDALYFPELLNEGLIKTYPVFDTINMITHHYHLYGGLERNVSVMTNDYVNFIIRVRLNIKWACYWTMREDIVKTMEVCGWYPAEQLFDKSAQEVIFSFEPKYPETITLAPDANFVYHASPEKYLDKILTNGLVPKSKNAILKYPDRIYLTTDFENACIMARRLESTNRKTEGVPNNRYVVYAIERDKLPQSLNFYPDQQYAGVVWTYDNISPSALFNYVFVDLPSA